MSDDPMVKLVSLMYDVIPEVLMSTGKIKNPWPNVDGHSGVILQHYGIKGGSRRIDVYTYIYVL